MAEPLPPDVLDAVRGALGTQYEIQRVLGSGAMGSVLLAHDRTLDRLVAVKIINPELAATSTFRQRFLQEARTIAKLRHHNIVGVHAAGEAGGVLYFVMEYVEGESLRDVLEREGKLPTARAVATLRELADALAVAHRAGVIHRDIKPENILIDRATGHARLTDFGIARSLAAAGDRMTGTGMSIGTPAYMSPEQASGEREIDGRSDLYSLGLVGYEMLAGVQAFTGKTSASVIIKQITEPPPPLVEHAADVSPAVAGVIERVLAKNPEERWADGDAMRHALEAAVSGAEIPALGAAAGVNRPRAGIGAVARTADGASASKRRSPLALVGVAALVVLAPLVWFFTRGQSGVPDGVDPRKSFLIVPFRVQGADPSLSWLRDGSVSMLALNLAQWRDISVVEYERSLDLLRDAKLDSATDIGLEQGRALARRAAAWTLVTGSITSIGDSLAVSARLWEVESGKTIGQPAEVRAPVSADPRRMFDQLANALLGVVGAKPVELELAKTTTGSINAYRHYLAGVRALNEWQLSAADSALGQAVAADSTFALAWYKRSLASGWRRANDTNTVSYARKALNFASRLPARERGLVEGNFEQQQRNWAAARERYHALLKSDSTDAEAWYALADAYYHDPDGATRGANLTASLAAFKRTLELDSTFHLAYSHRVDLYSDGGREGSAMLVENDKVRFVSPAEAKQLGRAYIDSVRRISQQLAVSNARQWVFTDEDAPLAYFSLAEAHAAARDFTEAAATLERAMARPTTRMADFPYRIASYQLGAGSPQALESLRRALREQTADSLRAHSTARRFPILLASANAALAAGAFSDLEKTFTRLSEVDRYLPGSERASQPVLTTMVLGPFRAAITAGLDLDEKAAAAEIRATVKHLEALPGEVGTSMRRQSVEIAYAGYMVTRDTSYLGMMRRWSGQAAPPALVALAAVEAGDSVEARRIALTFRRADTSAIGSSDGNAASLMIQSEVLARLGDLRGAIATLARMNPRNFSATSLDPSWVFYPRTLILRADLHDRLGETERAAALYTQVIEMWKDADPKGQQLVSAAEARLTAVRDRPAMAPLGRPR